MKKALLLLLACSPLYATNYYVSDATHGGNDSNNGTSVLTPFLTLSKAVGTMACGDTINVMANGSFAQGDVNLPAFPNCGLTNTIQSSSWTQFSPTGYRTNPVNDAAIYGKLQMVNQGIIAQPETHGYNPAFTSYCSFAAGVAGTSTFTIVNCPSGLQNLAIGSQIIFDTNYASPLASPILAPAPLAYQTHYYIVNCSASCGANNSTFQVSATSGGSVIPITTCDSNCSTYGEVGEPMQVNVSANKMTSPDALILIGTNTPVAFSAVGPVLVGTLPAPLVMDQIYYPINIAGRTFQISASSAGPPIVLTSVGTGMINMASAQVAHNWKFRGLEMMPAATATLIYDLLEFGSGGETSLAGMVNNIEVDHCYLHDNVSGAGYSTCHAIADNMRSLNIHDSWISGGGAFDFTGAECQAIGGWESYGPTAITNNFLAAPGEVILYGGATPLWYPLANQNKTITGNQFYKPPAWKTTAGNGPAVGSCWYDNVDPIWTGGEWYTDLGPKVQTNVGGGDSARFAATVSGGVITNLTKLSGGESYADGTYSTTFFDNGNGSGASVSITASGGVITGFSSLVGGTGYISSNTYRCLSTGTWATTAAVPPSPYTIKTMYEHKNGRGIMLSGNLFKYNWGEAQSGQAISWHQLGSGPGFSNDHNTAINNIASHVYNVTTQNSYCGVSSWVPCISTPTALAFVNNVFSVDINSCGVSFSTSTCGFHMMPYNFDGAGEQSELWNHNTLVMPDNLNGVTAYGATAFFASNNPPTTAYLDSWNIKNSIFGYDFQGNGHIGTDMISNFFTNSHFNNIAIAEHNNAVNYTNSPGATNVFSTTTVPFATNYDTISFVNLAGADYHLASTSPYSAANASSKTVSDDGTDLGADIDLVNMETSGAALGTPPWQKMAGLSITAGSGKAIFRYNAPTSAACTIKLYNPPIRIPQNVAITIADSSNTSVSNGTERQLLVSTITPSTGYAYGLTCGNNELIVGKFTTKASGTGTKFFTQSFSSSQAVTYCSDAAMSVGCTTLGAAASQSIPVSSNSAVYVQPSAGEVNVLVAP